MKMSDVFDLPMTHQDTECGTTGSIYQGDKELVLQAQDVKEFAYCLNSERKEQRNLKAIYAAHAINCHDELVAMIDSIRQCLEWGYSHDELASQIIDYTDSLKSLLAKARGEQ